MDEGVFSTVISMLEKFAADIVYPILDVFLYPFKALLYSLGFMRFFIDNILFFVIGIEAVIMVLSYRSGDWLNNWIHYNYLFASVFFKIVWNLVSWSIQVIISIASFIRRLVPFI